VNRCATENPGTDLFSTEARSGSIFPGPGFLLGAGGAAEAAP